jgi:hypothetical protein
MRCYDILGSVDPLFYSATKRVEDCSEIRDLAQETSQNLLRCLFYISLHQRFIFLFGIVSSYTQFAWNPPVKHIPSAGYACFPCPSCSLDIPYAESKCSDPQNAFAKSRSRTCHCAHKPYILELVPSSIPKPEKKKMGTLLDRYRMGVFSRIDSH